MRDIDLESSNSIISSALLNIQRKEVQLNMQETKEGCIIKRELAHILFLLLHSRTRSDDCCMAPLVNHSGAN